MMQSASMKISHTDFDEYTKAIINILMDPLFMNKIQEAQDAVKAIREIMETDFKISPQHEYNVLKEKTISIEEQNETLQEEIGCLKGTYGQIKSLLEKESGKREEDIEVLKKEIDEKESQIKELTTELLLVKKLIMQDHDLFLKMEMRVSNIETALDTTDTEFSHFKRLMEQMDIARYKQTIEHLSLKVTGDVKCQNIANKNEKSREIIRQLEMENEDLHTRNEELQSLISTIGSKTDMRLIAKQTAQEEEIKDFIETIRKLREENKHLRNKLGGTKESETKSECTKEKCRNRIEALEFENKCLKSESKRLSSMNSSSDLAKDLKKSKAKLRSKLNDCFDENDELKIANEDLKYKLSEEQNRREHLEHGLHKHEEEKQTLSSKKKRELEKFKQETEKQRKDFDETIRNLREEVQHLTNENDKRKGVMEELESNLTVEKNRRGNLVKQLHILEEEKTTLSSEKQRELENFSQEKEIAIEHLNY